MKRAAAVMAIALGLLGAGGGTTTGAAAAPEGGLTATACNPGGKQVLIGGRSASVFCGPATATVKLGDTTLTSSSVNELLVQPGFAIPRRATRGPGARRDLWQGGARATARPSSNRTGGTFEGSTPAGARVTGTVRCG